MSISLAFVSALMACALIAGSGVCKAPDAPEDAARDPIAGGSAYEAPDAPEDAARAPITGGSAHEAPDAPEDAARDPITGSGASEAPDYLEDMVAAAVACDWQAGLAAEAAQREQLAMTGAEADFVSFEELLLLGKIMYAEAGSLWLSDEWKMCVGEVVLNRVASPEFADTVRGVLEQPGQYYGKNNPYFESLRPSERCVRLALRLLQGERVLCDPSVVFQANFVQGGGVHTVFVDDALGPTYFCYSIRPELYVAG